MNYKYKMILLWCSLFYSVMALFLSMGETSALVAFIKCLQWLIIWVLVVIIVLYTESRLKDYKEVEHDKVK